MLVMWYECCVCGTNVVPECWVCGTNVVPEWYVVHV